MAANVDTFQGLRIVGRTGIGFPPQAGGYAAAAYNNASPDAATATWIEIRPDSSVTAYAGKVEYGQGIRSGLTMEVADELRLPIEAVEVVLGDTDDVPWDMGTFGSQSTARVGLQLRKAAATARLTLLDLAASRLDLPVSDLVIENGRVALRRDPSRGLTYGELVSGSATERDVLDDAPLTPASEFTVMGTPAQRVDALARVTGRALYSQDIILPGMLFARVLRPPSFGATMADADLSIAERMPGVHKVVQDGDLLAILADNDEAAELAARVARVNWQEQSGQPSRWDMPSLLIASSHETFTAQEGGDLNAGFSQADGLVESAYYVPYISNVPMEPKAAVAVWEDGRLTCWAGSQRPFGVRAELAGYFGISEEQVHVIAPEIGGGFGSKSYYPVAVEAARLARLAGAPVRVAYTRAEEMTWSTFRGAAVIEIKSGFKADGSIVAWQYHAYHAGERAAIGRRGAASPYDVPNNRSLVSAGESPLRAGSYRSLGGSVNHFARESHMDEIAAAAGVDPGELRLRHLSDPRYRRVLERAMTEYGWRTGTAPTGNGQGLAIGLDVGSYSAVCLSLAVQGNEVRVNRVVSTLDCGLVVNPEGAKNQMEGAIVMGLGTALYEAIDFEGGRLLNAGFARYRVPRINNTPEIEVHFTGDPETPSTGAGEPGIVPMAAAVANAIFDLNGQRHRELPIQRHLEAAPATIGS